MDKIIKISLFALICTIATALFSGCTEDPAVTTGSISGTVSEGPEGTVPLSGVSVSLSPAGLSISSDFSGNYSFTDLQVGSYTLQYSKDGYETLSRTISLSAGQALRADITLQPTVIEPDLELSVRTLTFDKGINELSLGIKNTGNAATSEWIISGVTVDWLSVTPRTGSTRKGSSSTVKVIVDRSKITTATVSTTFSVTGEGFSLPVAVEVTSTSSGNESETYGYIKGRVLDSETGTAISDASIVFSPGYTKAKSDADGIFSSDKLSPGNYTLDVSATGYNSGSASIEVNGGATSSVTVRLVKTVVYGKIQGKVVDSETGAAISGASVVFTPGNTKSNSDANGNFSVENLTPGKYTLDVTAVGYNAGSESVEVNAGATSSVTVRLVKTVVYGKIQGKVVDSETGAAISGASVAFTPGNTKSNSDANGNFSVENLTPGKYTLDVTAVGYNAWSESVEVNAGATSSVTVRLVKNKPIEDYSKAKITTCDSRVEVKIISCKRLGSTVEFEYTLINNGLGNVSDWRIYPPKSMSLISGGTRSSVWTDDGIEYLYPTMTFRDKYTTGANVCSTSFPQEMPCNGSVKITDVASGAKEFNLNLGVYAYPNSTYNMTSSVIQFRNVPIY